MFLLDFEEQRKTADGKTAGVNGQSVSWHLQVASQSDIREAVWQVERVAPTSQLGDWSRLAGNESNDVQQVQRCDIA